MRVLRFAAVAMFIVLIVSGCGGGGETPIIVTRILSDQNFNGDIEVDPFDFATVTQGAAPSLFAGIDPVTDSEFRTFLHFPLTGAVPGNAIIRSARLEIFIDSIALQPPSSTIPILIELVSFSQPMAASDYDRLIQPALAFARIVPPISGADVGRHVSVNVTSLMIEAQRLGLANFQVRLLLDDGFVFPGLIEINDATDARAPLLEVAYF